MRVFVAGATGVIGQYLVPSLIAAGHEVTGTTRSPAKAAGLRQAGATPIIADGLDRQAMLDAVQAAQPDVIVHQMTALAAMSDFRHFDQEFAVTNELRTKGTDYLLEAARLAGTRRFIAQSFIGWNNPRTGSPVKTEQDPLDPDPLPATRQSMAAIRHIEETVPGAVPEGLVLRYGMLYGHGASDSMLDIVRKRRMPVIGGGTGIWSFTEVTDAAAATAAAVTRGARGAGAALRPVLRPRRLRVPARRRAEAADARHRRGHGHLVVHRGHRRRGGDSRGRDLRRARNLQHRR